MPELTFMSALPWLMAAAAAALAVAAGWLRTTRGAVYSYVFDRFATTVRVESDDSLFGYLRKWLASHEYAARSGSLHALLDGPTHGEDAPGRPASLSDAREEQALSFVPARGAHWLRIGPYRTRVSWQQDGQPQNGRKPPESLTLFFLTRDRSGVRREIREIVQTVQALARQGKTAFHTHHYDVWCLSESRTIRPIDSVVLRDGQWESILDDARRFERDRARYIALGVPYRRGYLFAGPPGGGKTSAAIALAGALGRDLCVLNLGSVGMDDDRVNQLLGGANARSIVLIEEADVVAPSRGRMLENPRDPNRGMSAQAEKTQFGVTFSGLLNALDGATAREGRIVIMTANHPDLLDPALVRPGRIDYRFDFAAATPAQASRLFCRFYVGSSRATGPSVTGGDFARTFVHCRSQPSMAAIQGILLAHPDDPSAALAELAKL